MLSPPAALIMGMRMGTFANSAAIVTETPPQWRGDTVGAVMLWDTHVGRGRVWWWLLLVIVKCQGGCQGARGRRKEKGLSAHKLTKRGGVLKLPVYRWVS